MLINTKLCECGCGKECNNRFILGHNGRGKQHFMKNKSYDEIYGVEKAIEMRKKVR